MTADLLEARQISASESNQARFDADLPGRDSWRKLLWSIGGAACFVLIFRVLGRFYPAELLQVPLYFVLLVLAFGLFWRVLPRFGVGLLLLSCPVVLWGWHLSQGGSDTAHLVYLFRDPGKGLSPPEEQLRVEFNRAAELRFFPYARVVHRRTESREVSRFLDQKARGGLGVHGTKLFFSLGEQRRVVSADVGGRMLSVVLFPKVISFPTDQTDLSLWYLRELARGIEEFHQAQSTEEKFQRLTEAGRAKITGRWRTPVPKASALLLAASSDLARVLLSGRSEPAELRCVALGLRRAWKGLGRASSIEVLVPYLNNMGVLELARGETKVSLERARRYFKRAIQLGTRRGKMIEAAQVAATNLLALDQE